MNYSDVIRLLVLGAVWGASFAFQKVLAPVLGPFAVASFRLLIGGGILMVYFKGINFKVNWKEHKKHYIIIAIVNSAIPFLLFATAALYIPASYSAVLNSTAPLFGLIFSALWLQEKMTPIKMLGLILGISGVALMKGLSSTATSLSFNLAILGCLVAAMCYALAGMYMKKFATEVKPLALAGVCQLIAGLSLLPLVFLYPPHGYFSLKIILNLLSLALLSSMLAYLLYYKLVANVGATKALTVTFLIPVFGVLWGILFLNEHLTLSMVLGLIFILAGIFLVVRKK